MFKEVDLDGGRKWRTMAWIPLSEGGRGRGRVARRENMNSKRFDLRSRWWLG